MLNKNLIEIQGQNSWAVLYGVTVLFRYYQPKNY